LRFNPNFTSDTIPGIKLKYSNAAVQPIEYILEQVYNKPFDQLVGQYLTDPLNMPSTGLNDGATKGTSCYLAIYPHLNFAIVLLSNESERKFAECTFQSG
jgi:hypothetical protein